MTNILTQNQANNGYKGYYGINLTKESEIIVQLKHEDTIEENEKYLPCSFIGRTDVVKMPNLPKAIYCFSTMPINFNSMSHRNWKGKYPNSSGNT